MLIASKENLATHQARGDAEDRIEGDGEGSDDEGLFHGVE